MTARTVLLIVAAVALIVYAFSDPVPVDQMRHCLEAHTGPTGVAIQPDFDLCMQP